MTRSIVGLAVLLAGMAGVANPAQGAIVSLAVDQADSLFHVEFDLHTKLLGFPVDFNGTPFHTHAGGAAPPVGTIPATTGFLGDLDIGAGSPGTPGNLLSDGGGFHFLNSTVPINLPSIPNVGPGGVVLGLTAPIFTLPAGGSFDPLSNGPGTATYDFSGMPISISGGTFSYSSSGYLSFLGSGAVNFLTNAATATLPDGTHGTLTLGVGPVTQQPVTLSIPMQMTVPIWHVGNSLLGASFDAVVCGTLVLTGFAAVPEPGSVVLFGIGLIACVPLILRRLRR